MISPRFWHRAIDGEDSVTPAPGNAASSTAAMRVARREKGVYSSRTSTVASVIIGANRPEQIVENLARADLDRSAAAAYA